MIGSDFVERPGGVCVWVGNGEPRTVFNQLLEYRITEDGYGEFEACLFCRALGLDEYDPDSFGGRYFPKQITRPQLMFYGTDLARHIAQEYAELPPSNCYVLLYGFVYTGPAEIILKGFEFRFLGSYC